jgi:hypothetical protein
MIKEIHCFGTSYTAGGGFEFESKFKHTKLLENYSEEPLTQFNYSYPGQLQKIIGDDIKVFNHGQSGFGNELMYRKSFDIIESSNRMDDKLFILEFSSLGRKEIWSNTHNTHLIVNYNFNDDLSVWVTGISELYYFTDIHVENSLRGIVEPFIKETINFEVQEKLVNQNTEFFIDYLIHNKINFLVVQDPLYEKSKTKILPYTIDFGNDIRNMINYSTIHKLTITDETNGRIIDGHGGFKWAKIIASKIANKYNINKLQTIQII